MVHAPSFVPSGLSIPTLTFSSISFPTCLFCIYIFCFFLVIFSFSLPDSNHSFQRAYEEFKIRINALVAKAEKVPEDGWTMQDGTPWPGNKSRDHPGMLQVFLGPNGGPDVSGNTLPRLVYVSREKRPGYNHHKKAGAMNALVRILH